MKLSNGVLKSKDDNHIVYSCRIYETKELFQSSLILPALL